MSVGFVWILALIIFGVVFVIITVTGGFVFFRVFRTFRQVDQIQSQALKSMENGDDSRARKLPDATGDVLRCKQCGAVVDSTAELSAEGRIRCNYCNTWTSLYSQTGQG